ncbi:hypothetical protein HKBW3S47_01069 [Candidatus Hakubella thermalkaliphila]|uniref:Uncharacterized protein n=1 Tax=Candidatus Hakubella thermalkaliphila TaxID=2754717 RepID=A0A6V8QE10_9ACTN|nr:hypothetical protein HKBW3S47_01069 [Candidatus Hakubella thermalkaliphila]GFP42965.1 hypothetical protein HKBW3C_02097 [Candidatus Hakubella thermalkaliphila]
MPHYQIVARVDKNMDPRDSGYFSLIALLWSEFIGDKYKLRWKITKDKVAFDKFLRDTSIPEVQKQSLKAKVRNPFFNGTPPSNTGFINDVLRNIGAKEICLR